MSWLASCHPEERFGSSVLDRCLKQLVEDGRVTVKSEGSRGRRFFAAEDRRRLLPDLKGDA